MTIGMMIRARREELRMTLEDVSKAVGVSKATVSRWESGDIHKLKRDNIQALAAVLQMDPVLFVMPADVLTSEERELLAAYRAADDRARSDALETLLKHPAIK